MDYVKVFNEVKEAFDQDTAVVVVVALTLNLSKKVKGRHILKVGSFSEELDAKTRDVLWELSIEEVNKAIEIRNCIYDWDLSQSLDGLGGSRKKSLKEIYDERIRSCF